MSDYDTDWKNFRDLALHGEVGGTQTLLDPACTWVPSTSAIEAVEMAAEDAYEEAEADRERQSVAMADADVAEIVNGLLEYGIVEDAAYVLHVLTDYRSMSNDDLAEALRSPSLAADLVGLACARVETRRRLPAIFKQRFRAMDPAAVRDLLDGEASLTDAACAAAVEVDHENAVEAERWDRINEAKASGRKSAYGNFTEMASGPADLAMEREYERQQRDSDDRHYDEEEVFRDDH